MEPDDQQAPDPRWGTASPLHDPLVLSHFQARPTDVLITTAPKAGTTWMQQILHQLRSGGDDSFRSIDHVVPWLELPREGRTWREQLQRFESIPEPRVFKTHCTYPQTPGVETARIVLTSRDPRDCCVSFYHHLMDMTDAARARTGHVAPASFEAYFERWMSFGAWFRNVAGWWPHYKDENVLWLRYEDLKADLEGNMDRILAFLGWSIRQDQRQRILEYCGFTWMKEHADRFMRHADTDELLFKPGGFIRKGQVGGHKAVLSDEQQRRILERARSELAPECVTFLGLDK